MSRALLLLLLAAPEGGRLWSEKHGVGVTLPPTWTVKARDSDGTIVEADGPLLGRAIPHLVLRDAGAANGETVQALAKRLADELLKRPGWRVTAMPRTAIGAFPAVRVGLAFVANGTNARARFTVALLGGRYVTLELSAAASNFPGATFDAVEQSLEVKWEERRLSRGMRVALPPGWIGEGAGEGISVRAPRIGGAPSVLFLRPEADAEAEPPEGAVAAGKVALAGRKRESFEGRREQEGEALRLRWVHAEGWTGVFVGPEEAWEDLFPTAEAILDGLRPVAPPPPR